MGLLNRLVKQEKRMNRGTKYSEITLKITGASLPSGTATNAAFSSGLGKEIAVATDAGGSGVTITFNEDLPGTPIVKSYFSDATTTIDFGTISASSVAYTSSSADLDCVITLLVPNPAQY
jgi:hypothetical protein